jgi:hypothetical protein
MFGLLAFPAATVTITAAATATINDDDMLTAVDQATPPRLGGRERRRGQYPMDHVTTLAWSVNMHE